MTEPPPTELPTTELPPTGGGPAEPTDPAAARPAPRPSPSPTARARRTAAGAPEGLRRPRPAPLPPAADQAPARPGTDDAAPAGLLARPADPVPVGPAAPGATDPADTDAAGPAQVDAADPALADAPDPADPEAPSRRRWFSRRAGAGLVAVLAVLLLALAGLDGWLLTHQPGSGSSSERDQALSTAKTAVPAILSYDYRHFDADVSTARGRLTGRAVTDYVQAMSKTIKPTATKVHAVVAAQTDGAGVEAVSPDGKQVTVVVFGEQKVTNTSLSQPRIDLFRVRVVLDRVDGQWLVSKFDQI